MAKINWRHIEIFHAVMTSGNLTQAAMLLNTSQPTVSRELARLTCDEVCVLPQNHPLCARGADAAGFRRGKLCQPVARRQLSSATGYAVS